MSTTKTKSTSKKTSQIRVFDQNRREILRLTGLRTAETGEQCSVADVVEELLNVYRERIKKASPGSD